MERISTYVILLFMFLGMGLPAQAQLNSHLILLNESFLSPQFEATDQNQYQFLGLRLRSSEDEERLALDTEAVMAIGAPVLSYFKISDAAYVLPSGDSQTLILGRKKKVWSALDRRWSFGVIEPAFRWNPLNRDSVGLTGLFWNIDKPAFSFTAFWSPVYFPDQGPNYEINKNGQFSKTNPWFQTPPSSFRPFPGSDSSSTILYSIKRPADSEIVLQSSIGGSIEKIWDEQLLTRASYLYKPMNQLALGYNGSYVLATDQGEVDILPEVVHHRLTSLDVIWKRDRIETGFSVVRDEPGPVEFESDEEWTRPQFETATLYSAYVQLFFKRQSISFEALSVDQGRVKEVGDLASSERAPITNRYPFYQALKVRYQFKVPLKMTERLELDMSWTHSDLNQFNLVQLRGQFSFKRRWQAYTDMQFVRAKPLTAKNHNDISSYDNNDRLMVGVGYEL